MKPIDFDVLTEYVDESFFHFHRKRLAFLQSIQLNKLFNKNPFLIHAKRHKNASDLIVVQLETLLSIYEEKLFGEFLKELALKIAKITCDGHKSAARGVDLEFIHNNTHYIVAIRTGTNWINNSQRRSLAKNLDKAANLVKQSRTAHKVKPVLGICYGQMQTTSHKSGYLKVVGQNFWYLISEDENLYTDIIEPIGYRVREHNENFARQRGQIINRFTREFTIRFCDTNGAINWQALVEFNSGNYDLDTFFTLNKF